MSEAEATKVNAPTEAVVVPPSAIELRRRRRRTLIRRFAIFVGVPTLLAVVYYGLLAAPRYDATMTLAVESNEGRAAAEGRGKDSNAGNQRDARLLREHLRSRAALAVLDDGDAFRRHYAGGDFLARLADDAGADSRHAYFRKQVTAASEAGSNLVDVRVRVQRRRAQAFATQLIGLATAWIEEQNTAATALLGSAEHELTRARAIAWSPPPPRYGRSSATPSRPPRSGPSRR
ncbi:MAG: hypothetical protein R2939_12790 [Kofleriaceae bacterium]